MSDNFEKDLDAQIKSALSGEDRSILDATQELGWFQLGLKQFTGKLGWVVWTIVTVQIALFAVGIWCAVQFFAATETLEAVKWGISGAVLILASLQLKLSLMPQMQADRVIREIKRLQLMVASHT
jgi:hypothetical protein